MIEVEKKVSIASKDDLARLIDGAQFLGEVVNDDVLYDDETFSLTINEYWLRTRGGAWELKVPLHTKGPRLATQYDELEEENAIRNALHLSKTGTMEEAVAGAGYTPFAKYVTTRKKYVLDSFHIDIDSTDYGDSVYQIGEIELMVENASQIPDALERIQQFLNAHGLPLTSVRGKAIEYLYRYRPEHYQALVAAGVAGTSSTTND